MRVAVTGAGGYIGGRLLESLAGAGIDAVALVGHQRPWLRVPQVKVDVLGPVAPLVAALEGCDVVVHLAGPNEVVASRRPDESLAATAGGARRVAEAASNAGLRRFIYVSTVHVYGAALAGGAVVTEQTVPEPVAPYAVARLAAEHVAATTLDGPDLVVFRLTNSLGRPAHPSVDRWTLVTNDLARQAAVDGRLQLQSHGMQWRDFVALGDACTVLVGALDAALPAGLYNLASGVPRTVREVAELVQDATEELTGTRPPLEAPAPPPADELPAPYHVDAELLAKHGLSAGADIRPAITELVGFCLANRDQL